MGSILIGLGGAGAEVINNIARRLKKNRPEIFQSETQLLIIDSVGYKEEWTLIKNILYSWVTSH